MRRAWTRSGRDLPAIVTVDALPGKKFIGTVARIAPLPNAQSMWMNPDLKIYTTNINLETDDQGLRSGMSCKAEIIVEQYQDVVYIPVQTRPAGRRTAHGLRGQGWRWSRNARSRSAWTTTA